MKPDSVLCPYCHREWQITTIDMVRRREPLWCDACVKRADDRLVEAIRRYPDKPQTGSAVIEETPTGAH
ncbi:hypothetical protein [Paraburkholderia sp. D1E]|uniref:hypothetical protein n=1 Tax=Paraburkholderia sp. D1E TaxID=3461398 RepID=UPI0040457927